MQGMAWLVFGMQTRAAWPRHGTAVRRGEREEVGRLVTDQQMHLGFRRRALWVDDIPPTLQISKLRPNGGR